MQQIRMTKNSIMVALYFMARVRINHIYNNQRMQSYSCAERGIGQAYNYRQEIEVQIMKVITVNLPNTQHHRLIIRTASRLLRLNLLECSFLAWLLEKSHCRIEQLKALSSSISVFQDERDRSQFLLLLINGFYVKSFLCHYVQPSIDRDIVSLVPNFRQIYVEWAPNLSLKELTLIEVNQMFKKWTLPFSKGKKDYNFMVSKILQLSKSYNIGANDNISQIKHSYQEGEAYRGMQSISEVQPLLYQHPIDYANDPHINYQYFENYQQDDHQNEQFVIRQGTELERSGQNSGYFGLGFSGRRNLMNMSNNEGIDQSIEQGSSSRERKGKGKQKQSSFDDV